MVSFSSRHTSRRSVSTTSARTTAISSSTSCEAGFSLCKSGLWSYATSTHAKNTTPIRTCKSSWSLNSSEPYPMNKRTSAKWRPINCYTRSLGFKPIFKVIAISSFAGFLNRKWSPLLLTTTHSPWGPSRCLRWRLFASRKAEVKRKW